MDYKNIVDSLTLTFDPKSQNDINIGENYITSNKLKPQFCQMLMQITDDKSGTLNLRQSAVVNLKTIVDKNWNSQIVGKELLLETEKDAIKNNLLQAII